jgi:hypothetical protein
MLKTEIKGIRKLQRDLGAESKRQKKALNTAIKVEAFRQLRQLRDQIKKGVPGGHPYAAQLSEIAKRTKTGRLRKNQAPLYRLARLLRYQVEYKNGALQIAFAFIKSRAMTGSWKKLVLRHTEGTDTLYSGSRTELGQRLARIGGRLKKKGDPDAKFFFLRKTTGRRIELPRRPMVDPYWKANKDSARKNIALNFKRKLAGKRI